MEVVSPFPRGSGVGSGQLQASSILWPLLVHLPRHSPHPPNTHPERDSKLILCEVLAMRPTACPKGLWGQGEVEKQSHNKTNAKARVGKGPGRSVRVGCG